MKRNYLYSRNRSIAGVAKIRVKSERICKRGTLRFLTRPASDNFADGSRNTHTGTSYHRIFFPIRRLEKKYGDTSVISLA